MRGSIPLQWNQSQSWNLKPPAEYSERSTVQLETLLKHYRGLVSYYDLLNAKSPSLLTINLIDKSGNQGNLGLIWLKMLRKLSNQNNSISMSKTISMKSLKVGAPMIDLKENKEIMKKELDLLGRNQVFRESFNIDNFTTTFIWFDYHKHCRGTNTSAITSLYNAVKTFLSNDGMYVESPSALRTVQRKLIRTNCMDCLDRTNVVQVSSASKNYLDLPVMYIFDRRPSRDGH